MEPRRKIIDAYPNYEILDDGRVWSIKRRIFLSFHLSSGYYAISLYKGDSKSHLSRIHRLVAEAFVEGMAPGLYVNHKNGKKLDNRADNLEWVTPSKNMQEYNKNTVLKRTGVKQILDEKVIAEFPSIREAARQTGTNHSSISWVLGHQIKKTTKAADGQLYGWERIEVFKKIKQPKEAGKIAGFQDYLITNDGRVYSKRSTIFLKQNTTGDGYRSVCLTNEDEKRSFMVHVLVAAAFLEKTPGKDQVNHKNRQKDDNRLENLEYVSASENAQHAAISLGKYQVQVGDKVFPSLLQAARYLETTGPVVKYHCANGKPYKGETMSLVNREAQQKLVEEYPKSQKKQLEILKERRKQKKAKQTLTEA